jgi:mono/diheme cytochrome c family protein
MKIGNKGRVFLAVSAAAVLVLVGLAVVSGSAGRCLFAARDGAAPQSRRSMMGGMGMGGMGMGGMGGMGMARHMYFMRNGVPAAYRGKSSPLAPTAQDIREGAELYADNCATCHGDRGYGDGEGGRELSPRPANLARMIRMPMMTDRYLFWTLAEGGEPVGSAMPAFKDGLSDNEIWTVIAAMRAGFPPVGRADEQAFSQ